MADHRKGGLELVPLDEAGAIPVCTTEGVPQGGNRMSVEDGKVLDTVMLETLAVIAAANERSLVEELNLAVRTYVLNELAEHGELQLLEQVVSEEARSLIE